MLPTDPPFSLQIAYARITDWDRAKYSYEKFDKDSNSLTILQFDGLNLIISNSPEVGGRRSLKEIFTGSLSLPFSLFRSRQLFACLSLSRLPYYLRAWNRLYLKMHCR